MKEILNLREYFFLLKWKFQNCLFNKHPSKLPIYNDNFIIGLDHLNLHAHSLERSPLLLTWSKLKVWLSKCNHSLESNKSWSLFDLRILVLSIISIFHKQNDITCPNYFLGPNLKCRTNFYVVLCMIISQPFHIFLSSSKPFSFFLTFT
jgi:hypothetical protein